MSSFLNFRNSFSRKPSSPPLTPLVKEKPKKTASSKKVFQPNMGDMRKVFDKYDANGDGRISLEEFKLALQVIGSGGAEAAGAFEAADCDGDGYIDFHEFITVQNMEGGVNKADIKNAFTVFDLDGNGKISAEELLQVLKRMGERCSLDSCRKMVKGVDSDGDGLIDFKEFTKMMTASGTGKWGR